MTRNQLTQGPQIYSRTARIDRYITENIFNLYILILTHFVDSIPQDMVLYNNLYPNAEEIRPVPARNPLDSHTTGDKCLPTPR